MEGVERLPPEPEPEAEEREAAARVLLRRAAGAAFAAVLAALFAGVEATVLAVTVTGAEAAAAAAGAAVVALAAAAGMAVTGVVPAAGLAAAGFAAALDLALAEVLVARERGVAMTVMGYARWMVAGDNGVDPGWLGGTRGSLAVGRPVVDDSADREIGEEVGVAGGMASGGATGREHPVAGGGAHGIGGHAQLAFVVAQDSQGLVRETLHPLGADHRSHHLHDFHYLASPWGLPAAISLPASGSQWSMIPTIVRSLG